MRYSSKEATSSIALATLLTIGRFRLVETPIKVLATEQPIRTYSSTTDSSTPTQTEETKESSQKYVEQYLFFFAKLLVCPMSL